LVVLTFIDTKPVNLSRAAAGRGPGAAARASRPGRATGEASLLYIRAQIGGGRVREWDVRGPCPRGLGTGRMQSYRITKNTGAKPANGRHEQRRGSDILAGLMRLHSRKDSILNLVLAGR